MAERKTAKPKTFEQMLARLDEIVRSLEKGDAPLEESLSLYTEGAELIRTCTKQLDEAEQTGDPRIEFELELEPLELNMNGLQMGRMRVVGWDEVDGGDMGV